MGVNDRDYCEESMDKLLILLLVKHAKWGIKDKKEAEMPFLGIRLPNCTHFQAVNYERPQDSLAAAFPN